MPQRKTHDVYSGNQKVGEIWESYSGKTSYEAEMGVLSNVAKLMLAESVIEDNEKLKKRKQRMKITYIVRAIIGGVMLLASLYMAYIFVAEVRGDSMVFEEAVLKVGIFGSIGVSLLSSSPHVDIKKQKTVIPWLSVFFGLIGGFIGTVLLHLAFYLF